MHGLDRSVAYIEAAIVSIVLAGVVVASGFQLTDILSASAGLLTFMCTQIAFDMNEHLQAIQGEAPIRQNRYRALFFMKECIWVITFIVLGSLPLLASTGVFATYPYWRKKIRSAYRQATQIKAPQLAQ